jgi:HK97 family phage prohead protease
MENSMNTRRLYAQRETKFAPVTMDTVKLDGSFSGYASVFGAIDQGNDMVAQGAFSGTLKNRKPADVRMLFQHDPDQPIGCWKKIIEDEKGLYVEGKITKGVKRSQEVLTLMREGALDGLSIGFKTKRAKVNPTTKVRTILAADLWEISIVTFPLLEEARIEAVKSATPNSPPSARELERWLTRDAGLSRREAKTILSHGYNALHCKRDATVNTTLANKIRKATQLISKRI